MSNKDERPPVAEVNALVAKLVRMGLRGQDLASVIRATNTRKQNADALREYLRNRR